MQLKFIRGYFGVMSFLSPQFAAKKATNLFSTVRLKNIRPKEKELYEIAKEFRVDFPNHEPLYCYEMGEKNGKLVFLIHGWDSNTGSLSLIAKELLKSGNFRIIGISLPAHSYHNSKKTNMIESADAFIKVLEYLKVNDSRFDVVAHSFGSGVTATALSKSNFKADNLVFLTTPNKIENIFKEFKAFINLGDRAYKKLVEYAEKHIAMESLQDYTIAKKLQKSDYNKLCIIHDKFDKVLPYSNAEEIKSSLPHTVLITMEKIGHYRMLWNKDVVDNVVKCLNDRVGE